MMALAYEGLYKLTHRPSLTLAVSSSFAETAKEPGLSQVKRPRFFVLVWLNFSFFTWIQPSSMVVSPNDNDTARVNEGQTVRSKSPSLARAVKEVKGKENLN